MTSPLATSVPSSPRVRFRRMATDDLDDLARLLGDPVVMTYYPRPRTRDEAAAWIRWNEDNYARDGFGLWRLEVDGEFAGDCGLTWQRVDGRERLEVGYHLLPQFQGRGLATAAARACLELARLRGIDGVIALVRPENAPSRRVAERIGLTVEQETVTGSGMRFLVYAGRLSQPA